MLNITCFCYSGGGGKGSKGGSDGGEHAHYDESGGGRHAYYPESNGGGHEYYSESGGGSGGHAYYSEEEPAYDDFFLGPSEPDHDDDTYYYPPVNPGPTDDSVSSEEVIFIAAFQDNRFSSAEPIYVNPNAPDPTATGNVWLYADIPLQEETGIDVKPLLGFAQGTCQSIFSDQDGYCNLTYEFFDGLEVIATLTAEGSTLPTGPSILTIVGGTGELKGATGEVSLTPVSLDDTVTPPTIADDGSSFLGNPIGYYMEVIVYVNYVIADIHVDDLDDDYWGVVDTVNMVTDPPNMGTPTISPLQAQQTTPASTPAPTSASSLTVPDSSVLSNGGSLTLGRVICDGMDPDFDYCDCDYDCEDSPTHRCGCDKAWTNDCCGTAS
jgi:hypothetical protein